jgi:hypothetical protein
VEIADGYVKITRRYPFHGGEVIAEFDADL